jgi:hypothetical protein
MTPEAVSRLTPDQLLAILSENDESADPSPHSNRRLTAQREILDAVCARFGLTVLHLSAQPIAVTKQQVRLVRPDLKSVDEAYLIAAVKEYGKA